jgi:hypothetical protein
VLGSPSAFRRARHCWPMYCHCAGLTLALPSAEVPAPPPLLLVLACKTACWPALIADVQHVKQQADRRAELLVSSSLPAASERFKGASSSR